MSDTTDLYAPLIGRDLDAIPAAVRDFRAQHSSDELFLAVARFAILAFAPSMHSKHAVLASLSAYQLKETMGDRWDDLLAECARYAADSRQPWSEPPLLDPPEVDPGQPRDVDTLRHLVAARDRLGAERWLAARLDDDDLVRDLFIVSDDVILTSAAVKLAGILGERGRFAALRIAVWDMTSHGAGSLPADDPAPTLRDRLVDNAVAERGSIESVHSVFEYDAARDTAAFSRVCSELSSLSLRKPDAELPAATASPVYHLARDYGHYLRAFAGGDSRLKAAAAYNLENGPSFADWSLA